MVIGTDCTGSCKSNYHMITTTTAPTRLDNLIYHWWLLQLYPVCLNQKAGKSWKTMDHKKKGQGNVKCNSPTFMPHDCVTRLWQTYDMSLLKTDLQICLLKTDLQIFLLKPDLIIKTSVKSSTSLYISPTTILFTGKTKKIKKVKE